MGAAAIEGRVDNVGATGACVGVGAMPVTEDGIPGVTLFGSMVLEGGVVACESCCWYGVGPLALLLYSDPTSAKPKPQRILHKIAQH